MLIFKLCSYVHKGITVGIVSCRLFYIKLQKKIILVWFNTEPLQKLQIK